MEALDSGQLSLTDKIPCSENASSMGGSQIWLDTKETLTVDEMLKAICVVSANDCTVAMAEYLAGSEAAFVELMNEKAKELGMNDTTFKNCHGIDEDGHITSAYDISLMARELLTADEIKQLHYKMIIFPAVGYPMFRDTIIYKDFKIYKSGTINRNINNLENLNYTYFTVEDIHYDSNQSQESNKMLDDEYKKQKKLFNDILTSIQRIYVDVNFKTKFKIVNSRVVLKMECDKILNQQQILKLTADWKEKYHLYFKSKENKQFIDVHFQSYEKTVSKEG